jgi:hypothetical protein
MKKKRERGITWREWFDQFWCDRWCLGAHHYCCVPEFFLKKLNLKKKVH